MTKICPICKQVKNKSEYSLSKNTSDNLFYSCKLCSKIKNQEYYKKNREKILERSLKNYVTKPKELKPKIAKVVTHRSVRNTFGDNILITETNYSELPSDYIFEELLEDLNLLECEVIDSKNKMNKGLKIVKFKFLGKGFEAGTKNGEDISYFLKNVTKRVIRRNIWDFRFFGEFDDKIDIITTKNVNLLNFLKAVNKNPGKIDEKFCKENVYD